MQVNGFMAGILNQDRKKRNKEFMFSVFGSLHCAVVQKLKSATEKMKYIWLSRKHDTQFRKIIFLVFSN